MRPNGKCIVRIYAYAYAYCIYLFDFHYLCINIRESIRGDINHRKLHRPNVYRINVDILVGTYIMAREHTRTTSYIRNDNGENWRYESPPPLFFKQTVANALRAWTRPHVIDVMQFDFPFMTAGWIVYFPRFSLITIRNLYQNSFSEGVRAAGSTATIHHTFAWWHRMSAIEYASNNIEAREIISFSLRECTLHVSETLSEFYRCRFQRMCIVHVSSYNR